MQYAMVFSSLNLSILIVYVNLQVSSVTRVNKHGDDGGRPFLSEIFYIVQQEKRDTRSSNSFCFRTLQIVLPSMHLNFAAKYIWILPRVAWRHAPLDVLAGGKFKVSNFQREHRVTRLSETSIQVRLHIPYFCKISKNYNFQNNFWEHSKISFRQRTEVFTGLKKKKKKKNALKHMESGVPELQLV